ncbi:MAG: 50S ribosomal protein L30e [Candidatus Methanomethylophilaceae archaeon]|nr:50S ribosomal protein L30e [Candidatus Methanomethylophilaceae archaeon]MDY5679696.1 50S ribosomal protein L30e [Candidatus Methanomethylophilaceae archaeon]
MSDEKIDIGRALKSAISTGKVEFGVDQTTKAVKDGKAQMVILARNCPSAELKGDIGVKVHVYDGNNMELGALCGKPFSVSALVIIDKGSSNILTL